MSIAGIVAIGGAVLAGIGVLLFMVGLFMPAPRKKRGILKDLVTKAWPILFDVSGKYTKGQRLMAGGVLVFVLGMVVLAGGGIGSAAS